VGRSFYAFVVTQLLGAFNDNLFKQLILFLAASVLFPGKDLQGLAFAIFSLPFILFSGIAGDLSERFSKSRIMVAMKWAEIGIMMLGAVALQLKNWGFMLVVLFIMGAQSALFGPAKYGGIPEMVKPVQLIGANGVVTMTTFIAVLMGSALAGPLLDGLGDQLWLCGVVCTALALLGTFSASRISLLPASSPDLRILPQRLWDPLEWWKTFYAGQIHTIRRLTAQQGLMAIVLFNSAYWFNAGVINQAIVGMGEPAYLDIGQGEKKLLSLILAALSVAIGIGAMLAPRLARRVPPSRLVFIGAVLMVMGQLPLNLVGLMLSRAEGALWLTLGSAIWIGVTGAVVVVPLSSYLQHAPPAGMKGMTFGVTNLFNFLFLFLAGIYYLLVRSPAVDISPALAQSVSGLLMLLALWLSRTQVKALEIA
jgi:MFS family permease